MGNLVNLIRTMVQEELSEMARPSFGIRIVDPEKAERIKKLYAGHWIAKMIEIIEDAGENGISRGGIRNKETGEYKKGIADYLGIDNPKYLQNDLKALQDNGILSRDTPPSEKPEKEPGQRGRKPSDTSREGIIRILFKNFTENPDFSPSEEDITYTLPKGLGTEKLTPEQVAKIKSKALGLTKRGRPAGTGKSQEPLSEIYLRLQNVK